MRTEEEIREARKSVRELLLVTPIILAMITIIAMAIFSLIEEYSAIEICKSIKQIEVFNGN